MKKGETAYYLIRESLVAKRGNNGDFLFWNGKWAEDTGHVVADHLAGACSSEPEDSPDRSGKGSILMEMTEITEEEAISIINDQILTLLRDKWKECFKEEKEEWDKNPGWPSKFVRTKFKLNGVDCSIGPSDIGLTYDCWDQGFMETIQSDIAKDLEDYGATDIRNLGFID